MLLPVGILRRKQNSVD